MSNRAVLNERLRNALSSAFACLDYGRHFTTRYLAVLEGGSHQSVSSRRKSAVPFFLTDLLLDAIAEQARR